MMKKQNFFIYKYLNRAGEVIYVGLTSRPLKQRVKEHEMDKLKNETCAIEYAQVFTKADMQMYEIYYINKFQPKYNIRSLDKRGVHLQLPELTFLPFDNTSKNKTEISISADSRQYSVFANGGFLHVIVNNPYDKNIQNKKVILNINGEVHGNIETLEQIIKTCIEAANDISDDYYWELKKDAI